MASRKRSASLAAWTLDDVRYDPVAHTSTLTDGTPVPHVTAVLCAVGVTEDFEALAASSSVIAERIEFARARGTAVHADCHAYDDDDLEWASVDPRIEPWVRAWARCREQMHLEPAERERRVFHPTHLYTGIMDGVFLRDWRRIMIDIKTGDPRDAAGHLQTAAYAEAERAIGKPAIDERWAVQLTPDRREPYRVTNYSAAPDAYLHWMKFLSCLTTFREQPTRRRR